jgi:gliding motility-associated-like protein
LNSGLYTVTTTANGCNSSSSIDVIVNTTPQVNFNANILSGCVPLKVTFTNTSSALNGNFVWDFGDGTTSTIANNVTHTFTSANCFDIKLTATSNGCTNNLNQNNYICTKAKASANFSVDNSSHSIINPTFEFTNNSQNATLYNWIFGDGTTSTAFSPNHTYPNEVLIYNVTLIANNIDNCPDTTNVTVSITDELIYYIPNTMTPDGDKFNETFQPVFSAGVDIYSYSMYIYNRWGELLFESHDMKKGWDGTYGGKIVQDDTYVWKIIFKETTSDKKIMRVGHINVLK